MRVLHQKVTLLKEHLVRDRAILLLLVTYQIAKVTSSFMHFPSCGLVSYALFLPVTPALRNCSIAFLMASGFNQASTCVIQSRNCSAYLIFTNDAPHASPDTIIILQG